MTRQLSMAVLVFIAVYSSLVSVRARDHSEVRKDLDAQYKKLAEAHDQGNLKAIVELKTSDFHTIFPDGSVGDSKMMEQ